ncbi:MAG: hypothetical protein JW715_13700 [Sedimentisphaerales bacterium]|nr:hypothetical protein [Sedimentisphaerales bacterium]
MTPCPVKIAVFAESSIFQPQSTRAKNAVAKDNLRLLRGAIELYTVQHRGIPPGYQDDNPANTPSNAVFLTQLVVSGNYLKAMPKNPFNDIDNIKMVGNSESFPQSPVDGYGWIYQPATKTVRLNWSGTDSDGLSYYDY